MYVAPESKILVMANVVSTSETTAAAPNKDNTPDDEW